MEVTTVGWAGRPGALKLCRAVGEAHSLALCAQPEVKPGPLPAELGIQTGLAAQDTAVAVTLCQDVFVV